METTSTTTLGANALHSISPELARLFVAFQEANDVSSKYHDEVFEPARDRWLAARDAVPHITFKGPARYDGGAPVWSTDQEHRVRHATWAVRQKVAFHGPGSDDARDAHKAQKKLVQAVERRNRKLEAIRYEQGFDAISEEGERLDQLFYDAEFAVTDFAVTSLADLSFKLDFMAQQGQFESDYTPGIIRRDVASLQQKEA